MQMTTISNQFKSGDGCKNLMELFQNVKICEKKLFIFPLIKWKLFDLDKIFEYHIFLNLKKKKLIYNEFINFLR